MTMAVVATRSGRASVGPAQGPAIELAYDVFGERGRYI